MRPYFRLIAIVFITCWEVLLAIIERFWNPKNRRIISKKRRSSWGKNISWALGLDIDFQGNIPNETVIVVANHRTYLDIPAILSEIPCSMLAMAEVRKFAFIGYAAYTADIIFVKRDNSRSRAEALKVVQEALLAGISVCVFPEGTTNDTPQVLPFKPGVFSVAAKHNLPILPVAIEYPDRSLYWVTQTPMHRHFFKYLHKRKNRVLLRFGSVLRGTDTQLLKTATENWINTTLTELQTAT
jgi:1-acyl-sn-glycerol-3-phosphate acyltransferase